MSFTNFADCLFLKTCLVYNQPALKKIDEESHRPYTVAESGKSKIMINTLSLIEIVTSDFIVINFN